MFWTRLRWLGVLALLGLLLLAVFAILQPSGIGRRSYDRINPGMSEAEVEAVIGFLEDQHGPRRLIPVSGVVFPVGTKGIPRASWPDHRSEPADDKWPRGKVKWWNGDRICLAVAFDDRGLVVGVELVAADPPKSW
jgi:hypothetical protein